MKRSPIGLDKLGMFLPVSQCRLAPNFEVEVHRARVNAGTGEVGRERVLWCDLEGVPREGMRASLNVAGEDVRYQFSISPDRGDRGANVHVQFSAACLSETNLNPLDLGETLEAVEAVRLDLERRGAVVPLHDAEVTKVVRVDLARDIALSESVSHFAPIFVGAGIKRERSHMNFGGTGFVSSNVSAQVALYDKGAQMREAGYLPASCPENTLRSEVRYLRGASIKRGLGLSAATLPELQAGWANVVPAHRERMRSTVFKRLPDQEQPSNRLDLVQVLAACSDAKRPATEAAKVFLFGSLASEFGVDGALDLLATMWPDTTRQTLATYRRNLEESHALLAIEGVAPSGRPLRELYRELREKLLDEPID